MTEELVEWRLAAYSKSHRLTSAPDATVTFEAKVSHAGGRAILFLSDQTKVPCRPVGLVIVQLPDGSDWEFKFVKVACNVAKPNGSNTNELSELLRNWFGDDAGLPGTDFKVHFELKQGHWTMQPSDSQIKSAISSQAEETDAYDKPNIEYSIPNQAEYRTHVPVFDLVAAAGSWGPEGTPEQTGWLQVTGHTLTKRKKFDCIKPLQSVSASRPLLSRLMYLCIGSTKAIQIQSEHKSMHTKHSLGIFQWL